MPDKRISEVTEEEWLAVNPVNRKMVEEFVSQLRQLSIQTRKQYVSALKIYFRWVKDNIDDIAFSEIKPRNFLLYQNWLIDMGLSSSAIKLKRSAVSSFNSYIEIYYEDKFPTFRNYVSKAIATPPPSFVHRKEPLTMDEYEKLCKTLEEKELWQQLAYIRFSFATGARRAEVRQLLKEVAMYEPKVVEREGGSINLYFTHDVRCKGRGVQGKIRKLQFDQVAMDAIRKWLDIRGDDDCPYVFVTKKDGKYRQVGENAFNSWSDTYFEPIVGRRFHPHLLRESRATTLVVEQGKDIKSAQKLLDHKSSVTTEIYVIRPDEDSADDAFI